MAKSGKRDLHAYYCDAAPTYGAVNAIFRPLAAELLRLAAPQAGDHLLDVGTGWGAVTAEGVAQGFTRVTGVDFVPSMVAYAAQQVPTAVFCAGDMHRLPFRAGTFDGVLAQFAFNNTKPEQAFGETRRVMRRGGALTLHEWGEIDPISASLADAFAEYMVPDPPEAIQAYREAMKQPIAWDGLGGLDDLIARVEHKGLRVDVCVIEEMVVRVEPRAFAAYKLAWPARQREMAIMPPDLLALCRAEIEELVMSYRQPDGLLHWEPDIVRLRAVAV